MNPLTHVLAILVLSLMLQTNAIPVIQEGTTVPKKRLAKRGAAYFGFGVLLMIEIHGVSEYSYDALKGKLESVSMGEPERDAEVYKAASTYKSGPDFDLSF